MGLDDSEPELVSAQLVQLPAPELPLAVELQVLDRQLRAMPSPAEPENVVIDLVELELDLVGRLALQFRDVDDLLVDDSETVLPVELDDRDAEAVRVQVDPEDPVSEEVLELSLLLHYFLVVRNEHFVSLQPERDWDLLLGHQELNLLENMFPLVVHLLGNSEAVMLFPAPLVNDFSIVHVNLEKPVTLLVRLAFREDSSVFGFSVLLFRDQSLLEPPELPETDLPVLVRRIQRVGASQCRVREVAVAVELADDRLVDVLLLDSVLEPVEREPAHGRAYPGIFGNDFPELIVHPDPE